jgi:hypothetical protein
MRDLAVNDLAENSEDGATETDYIDNQEISLDEVNSGHKN